MIKEVQFWAAQDVVLLFELLAFEANSSTGVAVGCQGNPWRPTDSDERHT
jgi:hypothetical protein